ncbi:hypothetical protein ACPRNU_24290 [Chromobacterium vaccinii]|uniref:hypothetical protein n=1 Tax=Chromobacterium vaccinii TaxID=1108595 RepID=UPI003C77B043
MLSCQARTDPTQGLGVNWVSGPLDGHPRQPDLTVAGMDQIVGRNLYSWGVVNRQAALWNSCISRGDVIRAVQAGRPLAIKAQGKGNAASR